MTPRQRLFRLAVAFAARQRPGVTGDAIALALDLLLAGDDRPEVVAVAALSPNTALVDAAPLIAELLGSFGIEVSAWPARAEARVLASYAFAHEGLPCPDFDAVVYGDQDAWDEHDPRDQELRWLLLDWGLAQDAAARAELEECMRRLLRDAT